MRLVATAHHPASRARIIAGLSGFLTLIQSRDGPDRQGAESRFDTSSRLLPPSEKMGSGFLGLHRVILRDLPRADLCPLLPSSRRAAETKRIPRKNVRVFAGKPMITHSIECAVRSHLFERIIVSTDDDDIARIATSCGAEVPFRRPTELADDHAGTEDVMAHAVRWLLDGGTALSAACCIYATAPFVQAGDLRRGLEILRTTDAQFVFPATTFPSSIFRAFQEAPSGGIEMFFPENYQLRSQDLPEALHDVGQFYWGRSQDR
jgi:N-acylneuraminate cytidylyltransferase